MLFQPTFSDDKKLVLLQAADMFAGETRLVPPLHRADKCRLRRALALFSRE
jgi:hypothetical protein